MSNIFFLKSSLTVKYSKLPRDKNRPGKGSYWTINKNVTDMFEKGNYRRRKRRIKLADPENKRGITHSIDKILAS